MAMAAAARAAVARPGLRPLAMLSSSVAPKKRPESIFPPSIFPPAPDHHSGAVADEIQRLRAELRTGAKADDQAPSATYLEEIEERLNRVSQRLESTLLTNPVLKRALHAADADPLVSSEMERMHRKTAGKAAGKAAAKEDAAAAAAVGTESALGDEMSREDRAVEEQMREEGEIIRERLREQLREMDEQDREHYVNMFRLPSRPESPFFFMGKQRYHDFLEELDRLLANVRDAARDPVQRKQIWGNIGLDRFGLDEEDDSFELNAEPGADMTHEERVQDRVRRARAHAEQRANSSSGSSAGSDSSDDGLDAAGATATDGKKQTRIEGILNALSPFEQAKVAPPAWQPREFFEEHLGVLLRAKQYRSIVQRLNELAALPSFPLLDVYLRTFQPPGKRLQNEPRKWTVDEQGRMYATGKRKTAVARVWIKKGDGRFMVNEKVLSDYFPRLWHIHDIVRPFEVTHSYGKYDVWCTVQGGGKTGQAQAIRHGLSVALKRMEPSLKLALKSDALLTRDDRIVERKKFGHKKARKSFTWVKR